jgi:urease accessory protein
VKAALSPSLWTAASLAGFAWALSSGNAEAHFVTTGLGPIYDGVAHFALTPEDIIPVAGLAVLAGLRGPAHGRWALFVLPAFWLVGGAAGMLVARPANDFAAAMSLLLVGGLVAADAPLGLGAAATIVALIAAAHGYADGSGLPEGGGGFLMVLGMSAAVFVIFAIVTASLLPLRSPLARIAMRVSGSWIAASGLLLLGWSLRGGFRLAAQ